MGRKAKNHKLRRPKTRLGLPDLDQSKAAVIGSLRSPESQRGYRHAINEFIDWYCSEPRLSFNRTVVLRYRIHLESRSLSPGTINVRLAAVHDCRPKLHIPISSERAATFELFPFPSGSSNSSTNGLRRHKLRRGNCFAAFAAQARCGATE